MNVFRSFGPTVTADSIEAQDAVLGEMNFAFIDMGQGDCTIISCPDNSVFIVDCGSSSYLEDDAFEAAQDLVRVWANGQSVNLIITHPDKDHYNKYIDLLAIEPKVKVNIIFFSRAKSDSSPLGYYKETALARNLGLLGNPMLIEVTLNETAHSEKRWVKAANYRAPVGPTDFPETGYVIKYGGSGAGAWNLTIIAGNVQTSSQSSSEKSNVVSLCTMAQIGTEKLIFTGDATADTLNYLYSKHKAQITKPSVFQVPHHGSASSTPSTTFKNTVNPESLLVSVGLQNSSYNLPRYNVLNIWSTASRLRTTSRVMDYWKTREEVTGYDTFNDLKAILSVKWKDYKVEHNATGTFFWLEDPSKAGPSGTGFYGFTNNGFFLYRVTEAKDIYETGILGSMEAGFK